MDRCSWRAAYASAVGTSHAKTGAPCQDAGACRVVTALDGREILVAAVADGAGSAKRSEAGAVLAVNMFLDAFAEAALTSPCLREIDRAFATEWLARVQSEIAVLAQSEELEPRDFACTFLGAVVADTEFVCLQIGDGAIIVSGEEVGEYCWVFWPQHGEFANTTNFITQDGAEQILEFQHSNGKIREIALFSDGLERLILDFRAKAVHAPSLRPIFEWLATTEAIAPTGPAAALTAYLASEHINRRTDDDKSLVMATRATPPEQPAASE